tara:strand:+ start:865 stop:1038 length:174 start_codon:yes stop_codon:yes gene_type:complete
MIINKIVNFWKENFRKDEDLKFPCTYKPGRNSKAFEDSIDEMLREKYPEQWKKHGGK